MEYKGIIITGTSGSGKSIVASKLCEKHDMFQRVQSTLTRKKRNDDESGAYVYLNKKEFSDLEKAGKFVITSTYRGEKCGIKVEDYKKVTQEGKVPVMLLTPEAANKLDINLQMKDKFIIIFLDASDDILDKRLKERGENFDAVREQIEIDRNYKDEMWKRENCPIYCIKNEDDTSKDDIIDLIYYLYKYRNRGGLIPKKLIEIMIKCGLLLENAMFDNIKDNIKGASYDLRLGEEYFHKGEIKQLTEKEPFIILEPGDYALVSSEEIAKLPKDIAGRFDVSVSLFCKGVILSNGPQIDPGFRGRLYCLLFNTSNKEMQLKLGDHFATIEFIKLVDHTLPYSGKYQNKLRMKDYLPDVVKSSAINQLMQDVEELKKAKWYEKTLPLILSIIALIISIGGCSKNF